MISNLESQLTIYQQYARMAAMAKGTSPKQRKASNSGRCSGRMGSGLMNNSRSVFLSFYSVCLFTNGELEPSKLTLWLCHCISCSSGSNVRSEVKGPWRAAWCQLKTKIKKLARRNDRAREQLLSNSASLIVNFSKRNEQKIWNALVDRPDK